MTPKLRSEQPEGWSCQQLSWGRVHAEHMWGEDEELNTGHTEIPVEIPRENGKEFEKEVLPIWLFNKYLLRTYLDFSAHVIASGNSKEKTVSDGATQSRKADRLNQQGQHRVGEILWLRPVRMFTHRRGTPKQCLGGLPKRGHERTHTERWAGVIQVRKR